MSLFEQSHKLNFEKIIYKFLPPFQTHFGYVLTLQKPLAFPLKSVTSIIDGFPPYAYSIYLAN